MRGSKSLGMRGDEVLFYIPKQELRNEGKKKMKFFSDSKAPALESILPEQRRRNLIIKKQGCPKYSPVVLRCNEF